MIMLQEEEIQKGKVAFLKIKVKLIFYQTKRLLGNFLPNWALIAILDYWNYVLKLFQAFGHKKDPT